MGEEIVTRDCPGCGVEQILMRYPGGGVSYSLLCTDKAHKGDCIWWREFVNYNGDAVESSAHADTYIAKLPVAPKPLKLEAGKAYRTRAGLRAKALHDVRIEVKYPWLVHHDDALIRVHTHSGTHSGSYEMRESPYDIVAEWDDENAAAQSGEKKSEAAPLSAAPVVPARSASTPLRPKDDCACCHGARKLRACTRPNGYGYVPYFADEIEADAKEGREKGSFGCPECGKPREDLYEVARRCGDHIAKLTEARKNPKPWTEPAAKRFGRVWV